MENKKEELGRVKLASSVAQLALDIHSIYHIEWKKAEKMARNIVLNKSSDAEAFKMRLGFIKENKGY